MVRGVGEGKIRYIDVIKGISKLKKSDWLIVLLVGVLLMVIALPSGNKAVEKKSAEISNKEAKNIEDEADVDKYKRRLEDQLSEMLSMVDGAGKVRVMLTLKDNGEKVVEKDITRSEEHQGEEDKARRSEYQESSVYSKADSEEPYVYKAIRPQIEGVLVIAQGAGSAKVRKDISDAVLALFSVEVHKIVVVEMKAY